MALNVSKFGISSVFAGNSRGKKRNDCLKLLTGSREPSLLHCYFCEYSCRTKQGISRHLYSHLPSYSCTMCDSEFRSERTLWAHKNREHPRTRSIKRNAKPHSSDGFVEDSHSSHGEFSKELYCYFCRYSTWTKVGLSKHIQGHLPPYTCKMCDMKFRSERKLLAHEKREHLVSRKVRKQSADFMKRKLLAHEKSERTEKKHRRKSDEFMEDTHSSESGLNELMYCHFCEYSFWTKQGLSRHLHSHLPSYICTVCDAKFRTERTLLIHEKREHSESIYSSTELHSKSGELVNKRRSSEPNKELLHCYLCEYSSRNKAGLSKHVKGHLPPHICSMCEAKFRSERKLLAHKRLEHPESVKRQKLNANTYQFMDDGRLSRTFKCHLCEYVTNRRRLLSIHAAQHEEITVDLEPTGLTCFHCKWSTALWCELVAHMRNNHLPSVTHSCTLCSFKSNTKIGLIRHMMEIHKLEKPFLCDTCDYSSKFEKCLKSHKAKHTGQKPYVCDMCDYRTHDKNCLKIHKVRHTGEKPYACDMCDFCTQNASYLLKHRRRHTGEKEPSKKLYHCDTCAYSAVSIYYLQQHRRIHTGEKPYACDMCDYRCARKTDINAHRRVHSGERPYACDMCDYRSAKSSVLKQHRRRHFREKPYACNICDYRATRNQSLTEHMRNHTGEKPFACDKCDYRAIRNTDLRQHVRNHMEETEQQKRFRRRSEIRDVTTDSETTLLAHMKEEGGSSHERIHAGDVTIILEGRSVPKRVTSVKGTITLLFNCPECSFRDRSKPLVAKHISECHSDVSVTESKIWASARWDSD